ncbi:MAG TPA: phosphotransferase [Candidatus Hydrogenedentes bacterium]|nr:phosphotransferase [Candidatus Hydrogenedentota bacterium]
MVLEDVGEQCANGACPEDRRAFLRALGGIHGRGRRLTESGKFCDSPLPRFPPSQWHYSEWDRLLALGLESPEYALVDWMPNLLDYVRTKVEAEPLTLIQGDPDYSNVVLSDSGIALVDWEYAMIGPASADLGRALEPVESPDELESYRSAREEAGAERLSHGVISELADVGIALNSLRWICYYIKRVSDGKDPGEDWRRTHYVPCIERLHTVRARRPDWCET